MIAPVLLMLLAGSSLSAQTTVTTPTPEPATTSTAYVRPDASERARRYAKGMFGIEALGRNVVVAGLGTWRNSPREWGGQWNGFGKRVASEVGESVIRNTTQYGLDEALKLDSHFYRSTDRSKGARIKNALVSPFTARKASGKRTIGAPRIIAAYVSNVVSAETWYPRRYSWREGVRAGTVSLGVTAAFNLFREFVRK